jgi:hypothetical protein
MGLPSAYGNLFFKTREETLFSLLIKKRMIRSINEKSSENCYNNGELISKHATPTTTNLQHIDHLTVMENKLKNKDLENNTKSWAPFIKQLNHSLWHHSSTFCSYDTPSQFGFCPSKSTPTGRKQSLCQNQG